MLAKTDAPVVLAFGIPTINRKDLLDEAVAKKYHWTMFQRELFIVDNGRQGIEVKKPWRVLTPQHNLGVAGSWNMICISAFRKGYTHVMILNDDVIYGQHAEKVEEFIKANPADLYHAKSHFCVFVIDRWTYAEVGPFDDKFWPAYFEDNDYVYRCKLAGKTVMPHEFFEPEVFRNSQTIAKNPDLNKNFNHNRERYIAKWGGIPTEEKYTLPFNGSPDPFSEFNIPQ